MLAVVACSSGETKKADESAKADPWAASGGSSIAEPTPAGDDPWKSGSDPSLPAAAAPPAAPSEAPARGSNLAGRYECHQQRTTMIGGQFQHSFVPSALGAFVIDPDGTYRSPSYPTKGDGQVQQRDNTVVFDGGAYAGSPGITGSNSTGFYIRFSADLTSAPGPDMKRSEHVCYRQTKK